ncbi:MAG: MFS transporter [Actinomycetota bacterium]
MESSRTPAWRYAVGMFGMSIPINMVRGSMLLLYVDILGLDVRAYGIVMAVYAVIDAIDNPVLGHLSDRTRTRWGRRRPWLVVGAVVLTAAFVGFFSAPSGLDGLGLVAWFAFFAILCEAADSMYSANYGALLPELYPDERERALANGLRQGFQLVALVLALAVTPLLTTSVFGTEDTTEGFTTTARLYAVVAFAALIAMALGVRENPAHSTPERSRFVPGVLAIMRTRLFWLIGIASTCYLAPLALVLAGVQLYVKYSLGLPVASTLTLQGVVIVVAAAGLAVWTRLVRAHGAPRIWRLGFVFLAAGFVPLFFARTLLEATLAGCVVAAGWSGLLATNDLVQARLLDQDARVNGQHREGLYLSAFGIFSRVTGALNGVALALLGVWFGYWSGDDVGSDPGMAFRVYVAVFPFALAFGGVVLSHAIRLPGEERAGRPLNGVGGAG